jgi:autotransporter-associated beta strand protein
LGNPAAPLIIQSNATLQLTSDANPLDKLILVNNDGTITATTSGNTIMGPIVLNTNVVSGAPAQATISVGGPLGSILTVLSTISGAGSLTLTGSNELYLEGTNTYTGATRINSGSLFLAQGGAISNSESIVIASNATLDASQLNVGPWYVTPGQTLMGNGTVNSSVTVLPGATITVGTNAADIGALTINNSLMLEGTTLLKLDAGAQTNDVLDVYGGTTFGGQLVLSNITGVPFQAGQTFTLFYGSYSGGFASVSSPGPFLAWNTNNLTANGSVTVTQPIPGFTVANESGTNLFVRGGGGPVGGTYYILSTTNLALPTTAWTIVSTNQFDANGNFSVNLPIIPSMPGVYYTYEIPAGQ